MDDFNSMKIGTFSDGFKKFFNAFKNNVFSAEEMINILRTEFPVLAEELSIGKLDLQLKAPQTVYEPDGKNDITELYCDSNGYNNTPFTETAETGEKGFAIGKAYPKVGYTWNDDEISSIKIVIQLIFMATGRSRLMGLMQKAIFTDNNVTGAPNHLGFLRFTGKIHSQGNLKNYDVLFLNLKNFKYINKVVGNRCGDEILKRYFLNVNKIIDKDEIFARLGGDNFIALVKKENTNEFIKLIYPLEVFIEHNGGVKTFDIFANIGAYSIEPNNNPDDIMNRSSIALNIARSHGQKDIIWFNPEMMQKTLHDKEISLVFPYALENQEFVVFYQPKVSLCNNSICGCEALVRWIKNDKIVSPMDFIPVLEREGTICKLDFYVLEKVCQDIHNWIQQGIEPVRVSANFSKIHLHNNQLAEQIISIIEKYNIDAKYIEIELTEMSGYEDYEALASFVARMKEKGINTSIDDFGTGYSSLNLLKDLNVDIIKLDKSFLNNIENTDSKSKTDEIVIKNIVNMVTELNMKVVAEGVETRQQADFLKNINCCMAQGYLFDRPLKHSDFVKRLVSDRVYYLS